PARRALATSGFKSPEENSMMRNLTVAVLAVSLILPAVSAAQDAPRRSSTRPRPRVRVETRDGPFGVYAFGDNRGRIGVIVDTKADASRSEERRVGKQGRRRE